MNTAFLHGNFNEDIFMSQPTGFKAAGKEKYDVQVEKIAL